MQLNRKLILPDPREFEERFRHFIHNVAAVGRDIGQIAADPDSAAAVLTAHANAVV